MARTCAITALIILRDFAQGSILNVRLPRLDGKLSLCQFSSQVGCMVKPGDKTPFHGCSRHQGWVLSLDDMHELAAVLVVLAGNDAGRLIR